MADRAAVRLAVDLGFAGLAIATAIATYVFLQPPDVPDGICEGDDVPRYAELYADQRLTIAVVIGELQGGPGDRNAWSYRALVAALRDRGFVETSRDHFEQGDTAIDVQLLPDDRHKLSAALTAALADHDVVYFTGHNQLGELAIDAPDAYRVIVMDTCFSTQLYSARLVGDNRDVIGNRERAVTGSIESVIPIIEGLRERAAWRPIITELDKRAERRVRARTGISPYGAAEDYRLDRGCNN